MDDDQMDETTSKQLKTKKMLETELKAHLNDVHPWIAHKLSFKV